MRLSVRNLGRYSYIVFASETVVFDDYGKPVIKYHCFRSKYNVGIPA